VGLLSAGKGSGGAGSPRALGGRMLSDWDITCERVLGQKLDLWQVRGYCGKHESRLAASFHVMIVLCPHSSLPGGGGAFIAVAARCTVQLAK
jgi:hypothetical protein